MAYIGNSPGVASQRVSTTFTATAGQTTFTPVSGYTLGYCDVYQNGVKLISGDDYTAADGVSVVLGTGAAAGDAVEVVAMFPRGLSDGYTKAEADARYDATGAASTAQSAAQTYAAGLVDDLSGVTDASTARNNIGLGNVENKSSATIRGEITSGNVTGALGYTPVNKAGDTITGRTIVSVATGKQLTLAQWGDASSADGGQTMIAGNAYFDKTGGQAKFSNSHGTIGAVGIRFNSPSWNQGSLFTAGAAGSTADATFTPLDSLIWDSSGRVTMPFQPSFALQRDGGEISYTSQNQVLTGFNQAITNVGNHMNVSTGTFTAPVAGRYLFQASVWHNQNITSQASIGLFINGAQWEESRTASVSGRYHKCVLVSILTLAANDTVQLRTTQFNEHTMIASNIYNKYTGCLLG